MLEFAANGVAHGEAQARFASPWASLANLVLRRWLAYLPAPVTVEALRRIYNDKHPHFVHQMPDSVDKPHRKHHFVHQKADSVDKPETERNLVLKNGAF